MKSRRKKKGFLILAAIIVFVTVYSLVLPAAAIDEDTAFDDPAISNETLNGEESGNELETVADPFEIEEEREETLESGEDVAETDEEEKDIVFAVGVVQDGFLYFTDDSGDIKVYVQAPLEAFPEGTYMIVTPIGSDDVLDAVADTLDDDVKVRKVQAVDITFYDKDGNQIEPACGIKVSLVSDLIKDSDNTQIVHIDDDGNVSIVEQSEEESEEDEVKFESKDFSTYAIVETESITTSYLTADGSTYEVTVSFDENAGIPEESYLSVEEMTEEDEEYASLVSQTAELIDADADSLSYIKLLDISILDRDGVKVVPETPVDVQIRLLDNDDISEETQIVHFAEAEDSETVEPELMDATAEGDTLSFRTSGFSAYAIVQGPAAIQPGYLMISSLPDLRTLASSGLYIGTTGGYFLRDYTEADANNTAITGIRKSASASYPTGNAALFFFELVEGTTNQFYIYCYNADHVKQYIHFDGTTSLTYVTDEGQKSPFLMAYTSSGWTIRYATNTSRYFYQLRGTGGNIINCQNNTGTYFYIWQYTGGDTYDLDGKSYGLMYWIEGTTGKGLMASESGEGHLEALPMTVMSKPNNGAKLYVPDESDLDFWTFHFIEKDNYYLTSVVDGSTKYLRITSEGLSIVSTPDEDCKIVVVPGTGTHVGEICLKRGTNTLAYSGNINNGFKVGGTVGLEWLHLVEESELTNDYFMTYSAQKVSVSDESITNGSRIIVYTRVWNDTTKKYEFYAIDHDGSLIRCYENGDVIEWTGGRLNSMLWSFVEYYWEGTSDPNYYYELYNQYSQKFIAPQKSNNQTLSNNKIGINMNGRRDGRYYSTIIAWDEGFYAYAGLKTENGRIVSCPLDEAEDFYFAIVQDMPIDDELTLVPTVDHQQYGITMKMINFGVDIYRTSANAAQNDTAVRSSMSTFLGSDNVYHNGNTEPGVLQTKLGDDGYPQTKKLFNGSPHSLGDWFATRPEVNHLFIESTYRATGYFEFDSVQNFAHLNETTGEFEVYKELGDSASSGQFHEHGHFWPYNNIKPGYFSTKRNMYNALGQSLPNTDPRKYELLYALQPATAGFSGPDYYMGMEVTASFTQTPSGLDDWGHDIIYEFTGDDDFWLFVDGELIIDLGGVHDALAGSVNYRTGDVYVNGRHYTLKGLFESNYRGRNPQATDAEVQEYLDEIFDGQIFKDYTTHTMKIYYLERGAGASNLHMRFNLASIKPGTAQLTKHLSGVESMETILAEFPYQIIYRTQTGDEEPVEHYLMNAMPDDPIRTTDYVFYKDTPIPCTYFVDYEVAGKTYHDVFILKQDQTVDINFPTETFTEDTVLLDYRIIECGINTDVFESVKANDVELEGTPVVDDEGNPLDNREDFGIEYATTEDRARVVYDNAVNPDAITILSIKKRLFDVTGQNEITEDDDVTVFNFRLYLATESGIIDLSPANMHTYHVRDDEGNYCYWSVPDQRLIPLGPGKDVWEDLTESEKKDATFHTSPNGSITKIPVGYTVEIRDLLVGTKFKVVERPNEIPDGYSFLKYVYEGEEYTVAISGVTDTIINADPAPYVEVHNVKGFGLRVNKTWSDADFMTSRDPIYFGIYYENLEGNLTLVEDSLRQMPYGTSTIYWYYDHLPADGITDFEDYWIYEVELSGAEVDSEGKVTRYTGIRLLEEGASFQLNGIQTGSSTESEFTYTVSYERGEPSSNDNVRVDEVYNSRPGLVIKKTIWDGETPLEDAVFDIVDEDGNVIGTFISGPDGIIVEAFLRENIEYTLTETSAPQTYHGLESPMKLKLIGDEIVITGVDEAYYTVTKDTETDKTVITIKNRPYEFKVVKLDKGSGEPLANVTFRLYREIVVDGVHSWDPNPYPGYENLKSGADGIIPLLDNTLPAGKYQLREVDPLTGYQRLSGYITFVVTSTGAIELSGNNPGEAVFLDPVIDDETGCITYQINISNAKEFYVSIWKTDEGYNTITAGASFILYKAEEFNDDTQTPIEGATVVASGITGTNGILSLGKLAVGEYRLVERIAPNGFVASPTAIKIIVTNDGVTAVQAGNPSNVYRKGDTYWVAGQNADTWQIRVWNSSGVELPQAGGRGNMNYTIGGLLIIVTSILMLGISVSRKK